MRTVGLTVSTSRSPGKAEVMAKVLGWMSQWFWNDQIWLPPGYSWSSFNSPQLTNNKTVLLQPGDFAKFSDLLYPLPLALCLILVRLALQRALLRPLAGRLGLKVRRRPCHQHNDKLETAFRSGAGSSLSRTDLARLSAECGLSAIEVNILLADFPLQIFVQIQRWFRNRRRSDLPDTSQKFCETAFRFV